VIDPELDRAAQHGAGPVGITRGAEHAGTRQLHGAEPDPADWFITEK
jgi:hypothetical protein